MDNSMIFRYGSMNSGKSTHLIQTAYNHRQAGIPIMVCKPIADTKGGSAIVSRTGSELSVDLLITSTTDFLSIIRMSEKLPRMIIIDEVQFLTTEQILQLRLVSVKYNIIVVCYGLKSDFRDEIFPASEQLIAVADLIIKFDTAICSICKEHTATINARYDKRTHDYTRDGDAILIDDETTIGDIEYLPVCSHCYYTKFERDILNKIYK